MPTFKDLEVHILNGDGEPLSEWGTRSSDRGKNCSAYVESVSGMAFQISIKPQLPWPEFQSEESGGARGRDDGSREHGSFSDNELREEKDEEGSDDSESAFYYGRNHSPDTGTVNEEHQLSRQRPRSPITKSGAHRRGTSDAYHGDDGAREDPRLLKFQADLDMLLNDNKPHRSRSAWLAATETVYANPQNFFRDMEARDIEDEYLRRHVQRQASRQDRSLEEVLLETAEYDQKHSERALRALQEWADFAYDPRGGSQWIDGEPFTRETPPPAPYHLLATLRLDGKKSFEKRLIIYLDSRHPNFKREEEIMKSRTVRNADGQLVECGWLFNEVGIDTVLEKLSLSGNAAVLAKDEDELAAVIGSLGANFMADPGEKTTVGQIEVLFERVTVGKLERDVVYQGHDDTEDLNMGDAADLTHIAGRDSGIRRNHTHDVIYYDPVVKGEPPFATFRFYYRSADKLRLFGFKGYSSSHTGGQYASSKQIRRKREALANFAPLSITTKPPQYVFDDSGTVIAVVDADGKESIKPPSSDNEERKAWRPKHSSYRGPSNPGPILESPTSPPASTVASSAESERGDETDRLNQSPARGRSPVHPVFPPMIGTDMFRMMDDPDFADEDADDEADAAENDEDEGDEAGVAQNKDDKGLGQRLERITLGKRGAEATVEAGSSPEGLPKKLRVEAHESANGSEETVHGDEEEL